jgi:3-hydroxyisobutyrate dehydrogenase-like beta-hydroxyacid dehydrogenase
MATLAYLFRYRLPAKCEIELPGREDMAPPPSFESIGFIGLGVMGGAMCRNLVNAKRWSVLAFDLATERLSHLRDAGAEVASSSGAILDQCDLVMTCLPGGDQVRELFFGEGRLADRLTRGQVLVDMSTSPPDLMRDLTEAARSKGADFADAPIARTRKAAIDGTLTIMVGADKSLFDRLQPVLGVIGKDIMHCGAPGAGQVVKIMNNMVLFQTVQALAEAITLAKGAGVDGEILLDVLSKSSGDSFALRNHGMTSILPDDYPENAFSVTYAAKDLAYALEMARQQGVDASGAANVQTRFDAAVKAGLGDLYFPVIKRLLRSH